MSPRPFTTAEPGTPEHDWLADPRWDDVPTAAPGDLGAARVVVLAAHPDDETLGVAALVADLAAAGVPVQVVVATDGGASHPASPLWTAQRLATVRAAEVAHAVESLAPGAALHRLGLPDGGLAELPEADLAAAVAAVLPPPEPGELVLAPYDADGHPDHDALGRVAARVATDRAARLWHYPIWLWHWGTGADLPWPRALAVRPSARALHAKAAAIAAHRSQVEPLSPLPGDETLLPPHVLVHFRRVTETLLAGPGTRPPDTAAAEARRRADRRAGFEAMLADGADDPWDSASWYERRKHALTVALTTRERYGDVLEIGCATGAVTALLAARADRVLGVDGSAAALAVARDRALPGATFREAEIPDGLTDLAAESADLIVVSEVAYFLTGTELLALLRQVRRLLRPGGEVVLVDWLAGADDLPLDGGLVHDQAAAALGDLPRRVAYRDDSVRADGWGGAPVRPAAVEAAR